MARRKSKGFRYVGKEVQSQDFRVEKKIFFQKTKSASGAIENLMISSTGEMFGTSATQKVSALSDADAILSAAQHGTGVLTMTPTSNRVLTTLTAAQLITNLGYTKDYQHIQLSIINLAAAGAGITIQLSGGSGITTYGADKVNSAESGLFSFMCPDITTNAIHLYRLA